MSIRPVLSATAGSYTYPHQKPRPTIPNYSSAVDGEALGRGLYGGGGPSQAEETKEYMPPEVCLC